MGPADVGVFPTGVQLQPHRRAPSVERQRNNPACRSTCSSRRLFAAFATSMTPLVARPSRGVVFRRKCWRTTAVGDGATVRLRARLRNLRIFAIVGLVIGTTTATPVAYFGIHGTWAVAESSAAAAPSRGGAFLAPAAVTADSPQPERLGDSRPLLKSPKKNLANYPRRPVSSRAGSVTAPRTMPYRGPTPLNVSPGFSQGARQCGP